MSVNIYKVLNSLIDNEDVNDTNNYSYYEIINNNSKKFITKILLNHYKYYLIELMDYKRIYN